LTLVEGIGAKWARKLIAAGIGDLEGLCRCRAARLVKLGGISQERAERWIEAARKCDLRNAKCQADAPNIRTVPLEWRGGVDPYRLRRALELRVENAGTPHPRAEREELACEWIVTGGLEPHRVVRRDRRLVCDCADHASGNECKHVLAVRLASGDEKLKNLVSKFGQRSEACRRDVGEADLEVGDTAGLETCATDYLDVFRLWFDGRGGGT
jgi:hypothetical protein